MRFFESLNTSYFIAGNNSTIDYSCGTVNVSIKIVGKISMVILRSVFPISGTYLVNLGLNSSCDLYWWGTYNGYQRVSLINGTNKFMVNILEDQKKSFDLGIYTDKSNVCGKFQITSLSVTKISNKVELPELAQSLQSAPQNITYKNNKQVNLQKRNVVSVHSQHSQKQNLLLKEQDLITVILPTKNRFDGFKRTIENFISQTYKNFELIVIDDGSIKQIYELKEEYVNSLKDQRIKLFKNEINLGVPKTLNKGLDLTKGKYVTWVSDDNQYYNNYLEVLYNPEYDFVYSYWDRLHKNRVVTVKKQYFSTAEILKIFWGMGAFMWKKSLMTKIGYYDQSLGGCEDYDYLIRTFLGTNKILFKKFSIMKYVDHDASEFNKNYSNIIKIKKDIVYIYTHILKINNKQKYFIYDLNGPYNHKIFNQNEFINKLDKENFNVCFVSNDLIEFSEKYSVLIVSSNYKNLINNFCKNKTNILTTESSIAKTPITVPPVAGSVAVPPAAVPVAVPSVAVPVVAPVVAVPVAVPVAAPVAVPVAVPVSAPVAVPITPISVVVPTKVPVAVPITVVPVAIPKTPLYTNLVKKTSVTKNLTELKTDIPEKKISIVMSYVNRRQQLEFTLKTISYSKHKNIEVIVWDDGSTKEESIDDFVEKYGIRLYKVDKSSKSWINPVVGYNNAIFKATGDIVVIQNPEVCHFDDILSYINKNLGENNYFSFSCYSLANMEENKKLYNAIGDYESYIANYSAILNSFVSDNKLADGTINKKTLNSWVNHPTHLPVGYHYLSAIHKDKLFEMGGFDSDYANGFCHDDDDFVRRLLKHNLAIEIIEKYCIHQWHTIQARPINFKEVWKMNQTVFWDKMLSYGINETFDSNVIFNFFKKQDYWPSKIPKLLHLYWNGNQFTILHLLTVKSFLLYNPDWTVHIYQPIQSNNYIDPTWTSNEQKYVYTGHNYMQELKNMNVTFVTVDFSKIGFINQTNDVYKSDYLRLYMLYMYGGAWSDFDILYTKRLTYSLFENGTKNCNVQDIELGLYFFDEVFPIGLLFSSKKNDFFKKCYENSMKYYDTNGYQSIGASMWGALFLNANNVLKNYKNVCFLNEKTVYPYKWNKIDGFFLPNTLFERDAQAITDSNTIGIHWFNGAESGKKFCSKPVSLDENTVVSKLLKNMENIKWKTKYINSKEYHFIPLHKLESADKMSHTTDIRSLIDFCSKTSAVGFNTNGEIIPQNANYKLVESVNVVDDWSGCYIHKSLYPKISIICNYHNSKSQTMLALKSIEQSSYKNVEIVIVDVNSSEENSFNQTEYLFPFPIKIKKVKDTQIQNQGKYYNIGLDYASGDIVLFQNSTVCHIGDILKYVSQNINENNYLSFSCLTLRNDLSNDYLDKIINQNKNKTLPNTFVSEIEKITPNYILKWYNHPFIVPNFFGGCCAIYRKNIDSVRGFSTKYTHAQGSHFNDFLLRLKVDQKISPTNLYFNECLSVLPFSDNLDLHDVCPFDLIQKDSWIHNENIFKQYEKEKIAESQKLSYKIPKIFNTYFFEEHVSFLNYLTIKTFSFYNPGWKINIYVQKTANITANTTNTDKNYWSNLVKLPNVNILSFDLKDIGVKNTDNLTNPIKLQLAKWFIIWSVGGIWSDLDIFYVNSMENTVLKNNLDFDLLLCKADNYYDDSFFYGNPKNNVFKCISDKTIALYNQAQKYYTTNELFEAVWKNESDLVSKNSDLKISIVKNNIYAPYSELEINNFYKPGVVKTFKDTIGVKWYQHNESSVNFQNNINQLLLENNVFAVLIDKFMTQIMHDNFNQN